MSPPTYQAFGDAIAGVLTAAGMTRSELARRLRARGYAVDPSRISKWARGMELPSPLSVFPAIEDEAGATRGTILRAAGYVVDDPTTDVRAAILADPQLDDIMRSTLLAVYDGMLRAASEAAARPSAMAPREAARPARAVATD